MKQTIIFATGNEGKMREIRQILEGMDVELLSIQYRLPAQADLPVKAAKGGD